MPANGDGGGAAVHGAGGAEVNGNDAYQAPAALDAMEDVLMDELGFIDDGDDEEDEDDFIDEEVRPTALLYGWSKRCRTFFRGIFSSQSLRILPWRMHVRVQP